MSDEFTVEVEDAEPVVVVRPRGVLDAYSAADLRSALLRVLAAQPPAMLVDVSEMTVGDDIGLTVIASVVQQSERWPGTRIAVAPAAPDFVTAAARLGVDRHLVLCATAEVGLAELKLEPAPPTLRRRIAPDRDAPGIARAAVVEFCEAQHLTRNTDAAQLVASELVTNAVVHAGTAIELTLRLIGQFLHIAVRDDGPGQPRIAGIVDESSASGRGLLLVDALAASWGTMFPQTGKVVWATVRTRTAG